MDKFKGKQLNSNIEKNEPELILEIGPGTFPILKVSEKVKQKIAKGAAYVGVDLGEDGRIDTERFNRATASHGKIVIGDLKSLPIKSDSANEIWALNVFGKLEREVNKKEKYIQELTRVLKSGGRVIIGEYYGSAISTAWLANFDFDEYGFISTRLEDDQMRAFLKKEGLPSWFADFGYGPGQKPFILILTKKKR